MAQKLFEAGKGFLVNGASFIAGSGAPSGTGDTADAGVGSVYCDTSDGGLYVKKVAGSGAGNWSSPSASAMADPSMMKYAGKVWVTTYATSLPTFDPGTNATLDNGSIVDDGKRVLFANLQDANPIDIYTYNASTGTFSRVSPASTFGSLVVCQTGDYVDSTLILGDAGWELLPSPADVRAGYIEDFIGAGYFWDNGNPPSFTSQNYIVANDTVIAAIDKLDAQAKAEHDATAAISSSISAIGTSLSGTSDQVTQLSSSLNDLYVNLNQNMHKVSGPLVADQKSLFAHYLSDGVYAGDVGSVYKIVVHLKNDTGSVAFEALALLERDSSGNIVSADWAESSIIKKGTDIPFSFDVGPYDESVNPHPDTVAAGITTSLSNVTAKVTFIRA